MPEEAVEPVLIRKFLRGEPLHRALFRACNNKVYK